MTKKPEKRETEPELRPDGWNRFEKAVDEAVKSGPLHQRSAKHVKGNGHANDKRDCGDGGGGNRGD